MTAIGVDLGFKPDALDHGIGQGAVFVLKGWIAQQIADGNFTAFKQAGSQHTICGDAKAIARGAKRFGHRADKTDPANSARQPINGGRTDTAFAASLDGDQLT